MNFKFRLQTLKLRKFDQTNLTQYAEYDFNQEVTVRSYVNYQLLKGLS